MSIISKVKELSKYGEIIAGDKKERLIVDKIKEYFEDKKLDIRIYPQKVLNWNEKEIEIECEGNKISAISLPYSPSIDVETSNYEVVNLSHILEVNKYYPFNDGKILIFTLDNYLRKIVIKNRKLLSHFPQKPPEIPAFYIRKDDISKIKGKCRFYLKTEFKESIGYTIEGIQGGKKENKVYVTAHHDHWFYGEHDNLISVAILPELKSNYELHLISFTAEESGCFFESFSWACGSRYFLKDNKIDALMAISLDNITGEYKFYVTPGLSDYFPSPIISPSPYTDSYNFLKLGIPTVTVSSTNYPFYHSEADLVNPSEEEEIEKLVKTLNDALNKDIIIKKNELYSTILNINLPSEIRSLLTNYFDKGKYNELLRFYGGILSDVFIETYPFHKVVGIDKAYEKNYVAIEDFEELENTCENKECFDNYKVYLNYLKQLVIEEYIKELENFL